ncbi:lasso peptide biosynthesis B2 protein [Prauserella sp. ASG 168]|uniref:Lasso peptide biosynthesis B2 protein n=2 Tax=Prauserella cavernicola TaxID=2800127 RepID=A0A934V309_9PSEU|nr:lasso peptide biosynthesis B2 protein [Prauserella cavernicola]
MIPWDERLRGRRPALWFGTRLAIALARVLTLLPPHRLERVLTVLRWRARPATAAETDEALRSVLSSSLMLNAHKACLPRSIAAALTCRLLGRWPTWCTGVGVTPPFSAHAWVEVDGVPVGEVDNGTGFARLLVVAPADER